MSKLWVATRKGVFGLDRGKAGKWGIVNRSFLASNCSMVLPDERDGALYAALGHGHFGVKMHRSRDGGKTWAEIGTPKYPEMPPEMAQKDSWGKDFKWSLELVWALEHGGADRPGVLWCGTVPGGLFKSTDHGQTWELQRNLWDESRRQQWFGGGMDLPGIHSICVHPEDSDHVAVGVSCAGVWVTRNGGETWACKADGMRAEYMPPEKQFEPSVQDPHRVVQSKKDPASLWAQHHNGIFRTADTCASWQEITAARPSGFGFAVVVHPQEGDTAWFVPAVKDEHRIPADGKVVVSRTRDGGKSFDVLTKGLPQVDAYDLVFRHALDIDSTGTMLAFGSTTGSLWVSEDQGDSWETVSEHLPPVYAVRFEQN
jgi:hypothetical protein